MPIPDCFLMPLPPATAFPWPLALTLTIVHGLWSAVKFGIFLVFDGKRGSVRRRISGPTARDSLAQSNGLGSNVGEPSGPTARDSLAQSNGLGSNVDESSGP